VSTTTNNQEWSCPHPSAKSSSTSPAPSTRAAPRTPDGVSGAQEIAKAPPPAGAYDVKAFNTLFGHVLAADQAGGRSQDVFIVGDDDGTRARLRVPRCPDPAHVEVPSSENTRSDPESPIEPAVG
jgi:hypothetical protein